MIRISKILLCFTAVVLLAWLLPWSYSFVTPKPHRNPFTLYSTVVGNFAWVQASENGSGASYHDAAGNTYTNSQFDSILPFFYYRQLINDGKFPDTLNGVAVSPRTAQTENFMFRMSPRSTNARPVGLYALLESMSGRVDLSMPDDVFRIDRKGITFIDSKTNRTEAEKSERFTEMLRSKGFVFPAGIIAGNPTTRKDYDEGYLLTDSEGKLFHLKQTVGRPYVRAIDLPAGVSLAHMVVTEFRGRHFLGFIADTEGNLYTLQTQDYNLKKLDLPPLDLKQQNVMINANVFDWTVQVTDPGGEVNLYAINTEDYSRIKQMVYPGSEQNGAEKAEKFIFPFRLSFTSPLDTIVFPRLTGFSAWSLILGLVLCTVYFIWRRSNPLQRLPQAIFLILFGLYAFIPLALLSKR